MSLDKTDKKEDFPCIIEPRAEDGARGLPALLEQDNKCFHELLLAHGALLFRGFKVSDASTFEAVARAGTPNLVDYTGGGSPRSCVEGKVYTSTEYPANQDIPLHCEESYFSKVPDHIWFFCEVPPAQGGQTPIGKFGELINRLDDKLVERFRDRGVRYVYNLHGGNGFGRGWKEAFLTEDRDIVSNWLNTHQASYCWKDDGSLRMDLSGPGLRHHCETSELVWGNQAVNWHIDALPEKMASMMRRMYGSAGNYPKHAIFGDGSPIPSADIKHILATQAAMEVTFDWEQGDVLWCDNQRIAHGRRTFKGQRRVLVTLA